jgi:hypothetical protein
MLDELKVHEFRAVTLSDGKVFLQSDKMNGAIIHKDNLATIIEHIITGQTILNCQFDVKKSEVEDMSDKVFTSCFEIFHSSFNIEKAIQLTFNRGEMHSEVAQYIRQSTISINTCEGIAAHIIGIVKKYFTEDI